MIRILATHLQNATNNLLKSSISSNHMMFRFYSSDIENTKVKKLIEQLTKNPQTICLPAFLPKVYILPDREKEIVIKYILMGIYESKISHKDGKDKLEEFLKMFPDIYLQYNMWNINQMEKLQNQQTISEKKRLEKLINDRYLDIYRNILPSINNQFKKLRAQSLFNKNFGRHLLQLINETDFTQAQIRLHVTKGKRFLEKAIQCFKSIIIHELKKLQSEDFKEEKKKNSEIHTIRENALKENIRRLVEAIGQCSYSIFTQLSRLKLLIIREQSNESLNAMLEMYAIFEECIKMYSVIPNIKASSIYYHRITKINIEIINKIQKLQAKKNNQSLTAQKITISKMDIIKKLEQFERECLQHIEYGNSSEIIKQICIAVLTVKYHLCVKQNFGDIDRFDVRQIAQIRFSLQDYIAKIVPLVKQQYRKASKKLLIEILNHLIPRLQ